MTLAESLAEAVPAIFAELKPFCSSSAIRYDLGDPICQDGYVYATNGVIAARVKQDGLEAFQKSKPDFGEVFKQFKGPFKPASITVPDCEICKNERVVMVDSCEWCKGSGIVSHDCDCEYCDRHNDRCDKCNGKGKVEPEEQPCECCSSEKAIDFDGYRIGVATAQLLSVLPGLQVSSHRGVSLTPISFTSSNGIEGLFMPFSRTKL